MIELLPEIAFCQIITGPELVEAALKGWTIEDVLRNMPRDHGYVQAIKEHPEAPGLRLFLMPVRPNGDPCDCREVVELSRQLVERRVK